MRKISIRSRRFFLFMLRFPAWQRLKLVFSTSLQTQQLYTLAQLNLLLNNGFLIHIAFRKADPPHAPGFPQEGSMGRAENFLNKQAASKLEVRNNLWDLLNIKLDLLSIKDMCRSLRCLFQHWLLRTNKTKFYPEILLHSQHMLTWKHI